jgi:predicted nucleic acid-binding protein
VQRGVALHGSDREGFWAAGARLAAKGAPPVELADAMNAFTMDKLGIRAVWSYDRYYERLGYHRVG